MSAVSIEATPASSQRRGGTRPEAACPSAPRARFALLVGLLAFVTGALYAFCVPAGAGPDEPMHVARVEQLAEGQLLPQTVGADDVDTTLVAPTSDRYVAYGGQTDAALYELVVRGDLTYYDIAAGLDSADLAFPTWEDERLSTDVEMGDETVTWIFPNTAINSPVSYAPHVLAYLVATRLTSSPVAVVIAMRIAGVLTFALAVWACLRLLPAGQCVFAVVALLPSGLMVNSMVTADLMTFVCASLYVCCLLRMLLLERAGRLEWAVLWASLFCLCLCKTTYAPLGLLLLCLPALSRVWRAPRNLVRIGVVGFTSLAAFIAWYLLVHDINTGLMWSAEIEPEAQTAYVLANPLTFLKLVLRGLLGTNVLLLGNNTYYSFLSFESWPIVLPLLVAISLESGRLAGEGRMGLRRSLALALSLLLVVGLVVLLIYFALYLQYNAPGATTVQGVQTRYFLPLLFAMYFALIVLICGCSSIREETKVRGLRARHIRAEVESTAGVDLLAGNFPLSVRELPLASYVLMSALLLALSALSAVSLLWSLY